MGYLIMKRILLVSLLLSIASLAQAQKMSLLDSGYAFYDAGEYDKAIKIFERGIDATPDNAELYYLLGVCQSLNGDNYTAIQNYEKAIALAPDYAEVYYEKGYAHYLMGKLEQAMEAFDKAIALRPNYAEAYVNRGSLKCMQGDSTGAEADWEKAASLGAALPVRKCD